MNIPLSEGFELCFCLIVSEREKRRRRKSTSRDSEKQAHRLTEDQSAGCQCSTAAKAKEGKNT